MSDTSDKIQREILAHKLISGQATQEERDNALASIMLSMWSMSDLKNAFDGWHESKCESCPARKIAEEAGLHRESDSDWKKIALEILKYSGWLIAIVATLLKVNIG